MSPAWILGIGALLWWTGTASAGARRRAWTGQEPRSGMLARGRALLTERLRDRQDRTDLEQWPALIQQMAALLRSGVGPGALWRELGTVLGSTGSDGPVPPDSVAADLVRLVESVGARAAIGLDVPTGLAQATVRHELSIRVVQELDACWSVSSEIGAPLATVMERYAAALEDDLDARAARETALAGPRATGRILSGLPLLGLGLGMVMGTDPVGVLLGQVWGHLALGVGLVLSVLGAWWTRRLVAVAERGGAS